MLLARGTPARCQTRARAKLNDLASSAEVHEFDPADRTALGSFVRGCSAIVYALGIDRLGPTTLFSASTTALLDAMRTEGVERLIAITGVGAGETRGHGGFLYDRILYPLFTRHRYRDKNIQEALIAASALRWTIVRPAPVRDGIASAPLEVLTRIEPDTMLTCVAREEVARFVVDELEDERYVGLRPFIGHRV
jgi:putative NADH-flavin reductase